MACNEGKGSLDVALPFLSLNLSIDAVDRAPAMKLNSMASAIRCDSCRTRVGTVAGDRMIDQGVALINKFTPRCGLPTVTNPILSGWDPASSAARRKFVPLRACSVRQTDPLDSV